MSDQINWRDELKFTCQYLLQCFPDGLPLSVAVRYINDGRTRPYSPRTVVSALRRCETHGFAGRPEPTWFFWRDAALRHIAGFDAATLHAIVGEIPPRPESWASYDTTQWPFVDRELH